jgi:hypothetical protein
MDRVRRIADAVLYEGYVLWPYRKSATKNRRRWTFGGVYPAAHAAGRDDDPDTMRAEVLLEGDPAGVDVTVRFLQVVRRQVVTAEGEPVEELDAGGERHVSWEEAVERELGPGPIDLAAAEEAEPLAGGARIVRSWQALRGSVDVAAVPDGPGLWRIAVTVHNSSPFAAAGTREEALAQTFCSAHVVLRARRGPFVSLTDPPAELRDAAARCENVGVWPVLAGAPGDRSTMLASPIILADHPEIAPESPGDFFDAAEIDQMLVLNVLALTDEEKAEMRASDPRAREILERTEALSEGELAALHGTIREFGLARRS